MASAPPPPIRRTFRSGLVAALGLAAVLASPATARSQTVPTLGGIAGGFVVGTYTMTAIYVTEARFGRYLFSVEDAFSLRPELLPLVAGPVVGGWLGYRSGPALSRAAGWGALGLAGGTMLGVAAGHLLWRTDEGRWAGGIIGGAVGLLAGSILGAHDVLGDEGDPDPVPVFSLTIPFG